LDKTDVVITKIRSGIIENQTVGERSVFENEPWYETEPETEAGKRENGFVSSRLCRYIRLDTMEPGPSIEAITGEARFREDERNRLEYPRKGFWGVGLFPERKLSISTRTGRNEHKRGFSDRMAFKIPVTGRRDRVEPELRPPFADRFCRAGRISRFDRKSERRMFPGKGFDERRED
jgi:hypothetical protein